MSAIDRAALIGALPYARRFARALTGARRGATRWWRRRCGAGVAAECRPRTGRDVALCGAIGDAVAAPEPRATPDTPLSLHRSACCCC